MKDNIKRVGLLGGIVWNKTTGNIVSGHQRVTVLDEINNYSDGRNDYEINVEVVEMSEKEEKEQNLFMNNKNVQGEFDENMLKTILTDIDYSNAGFSDFDLDMLGIGEVKVDEVYYDHVWKKEDVLKDDSELEKVDEETLKSEEDTTIDRNVNFYEDSKENQIKRHNEVEKIKERINASNDVDKDGGVLSYLVISFKNPKEKEEFLLEHGFDLSENIINIDDLREFFIKQ